MNGANGVPDRLRRHAAAIAAGVFTVGVATMLVAQLALMSVLHTARAARAAETVASSELVTNTVRRAVRDAVAPAVGNEVADQLAAAAIADPLVRTAVRVAIVEAHRSIVEPGDPGNDALTRAAAAVATSITEAGGRAGVDVSVPAAQVRVPQLDATRVPRIGLRTLAERSRLVGALVALTAAVTCVAVHPRRGRAVSMLGWCATGVCVTWAAALLLTTWIIDQVDETVVGELLGELWQLAVPSMLGVLGAGVLLGAGAWIGGRALDGLLHGPARRGVR